MSASADSRAAGLLSTLVVPGVESLVGPEQQLAAERARHLSPEATMARRSSRGAYGNLSAPEAADLAVRSFPEVLTPTMGRPRLAEGRRITDYLSANAASVDLGDGRRGVIESSVPIAALDAWGRPRALDLRLRETTAGYEPAMAASEVRLGDRSGDAVKLLASGLSIAPVQRGADSEGVLAGAGVLYANTQTDTDTLVKPLAQGVAVDAVLRSPASPEQLAFEVSGPGALTLSQGRSGTVRVALDGDVVATVQAPGAQDAAGTRVPVAMHVSGRRLELEVPHGAGDYQYPIEVDPTVTDTRLAEIYGFSPWRAGSFNGVEGPFYFRQNATTIETFVNGGTYAVGNWGAWAYETQGVSKIYSFGVETTGSNPGSNIENRVLVLGHSGVEGQTVLPGTYGMNWTVVCGGSCTTGGSENNAAEFAQFATSTGNAFTSTMYRSEVMISQEATPTVGADTTDLTIEGKTNVAHTGGWLGSVDGRYGVSAHDTGIGVGEMKYTSPQAPGFQITESYFGGMTHCKGVQCEQQLTEGIAADWGFSKTMLPEGKDTVEVTASNATHGSTKASMEVKVDRTPAHDLTIAGLPGNNEIGDGVYKLRAEAGDGAGATPSSGVAPLVVAIDGKALGSPQGGCSVGPCSTKGEWTLSGSEFAVGQHVLLLTATDYAGNKATKEMALFVSRPVTPVGVGPGAVNPESGELTLNAADVSIAAPGGALTVARGYGSEHLTAGAEGPLGGDWTLDLGGSQSLTKLSTGSVLLSSGGGLQSVFTPKAGGEYTAPKGDENLKLTESTVGEKIQFQLSANGGSVTTFTLPSGGTGNTWVPTSEAGPNKTNVATYSYQVAGGIIEPTEVLAPVPANVTCTTTLVRGCRALRFVYGASTTATGEGSSQWGDYVGRLKQVTFTAWDPATAAMATTVVSQYSYDKLGRLRAQWDPRVSPALKVTYGYDGSERVTSVVPPGEQPWLLAYGTGVGDVRTGHLLSATRPAPTTAAGPGVTPQNTALPTLSSTNAPEGKTVTVSTGTWSNTPLAYSYQWQECQTVNSVEVCSPIAGATNASYVSVYHGPSRWLKAVVSATNANGAGSAATAATGIVLANSYMEKTGEFGAKGSGNGQLSLPKGIAADKSGNVWVADTANNRVEKFSSTGAFVAAYGTVGSGNLQFKAPAGIAIDSWGTVWVADTGNKRVEALTSAGAYTAAFATTAAPGALATIAVGSEQFVYVAEGDQIATYHGALPTLMQYLSVIGGSGTGNGQFKTVGGLAVDEPNSLLYATDSSNDRVQLFQTSSTSPTYLSQFGSSGTADGQFGVPVGIDLQAGNVFVADTGNSQVQKFIGGASLGTYSDTAGTSGVALYPKTTNGSMYVLNFITSMISKWVTATRPPFVPAPPKVGTSSVWTVEYGVPVSGTGAPNAMASADVAKWGQTDVPVEAMAVLPPDSPQGWPASSYARATVHYLDSDGREVNVASPDGGISTTEYNAKNDVVRSLTSANRGKALAEGAKAAEVSHLLDTQSTYSEDGSELLTSMGPQHTVKLASGSQVLARHKSHYYYNEGAPGTGGPYHLVTKLTEGALLTGGTEEDVHTTVNSYAGQEGLGWKLHAPTSITTDPTGLKIVRTKLYDAATGYVTDALMPAGSPSGGDSHDTQTIYYSALANAKIPACGLHPEWANLVCQSKLAKDPGTGGVPNPPVTTLTYNLWDEGLETTAVVGADSRTLVQAYDAGGRLLTATLTSTAGTALPAVKVGYDSASGRLTTSSATEGATTRTLTSVFDKWGRLETYTDADGVPSKYSYDVDGRPLSSNDGKGTQTVGYDASSGLQTSLVDSTGTFGATYNVDGSIATEVFPNGMTEKYTYDATSQLTGLEYVKTSNCASNCTWYADSAVPSITGQWLTRSSTLSSQAYKYDAAARLTQVQDTPAGQGCTTRLYAYDIDGNRTGQTTRSPGAGGVCATEGGTTVAHSYDAADRLIDAGSTYDAFGNTTSVPAGDAGGTVLSSTFFVNGVVASQTQNGQTNGYHLDPTGRARELVATGTKALTSVMHYAQDGDSPSWTAEGATGWTRNVTGIGGSLVATQTNGESPVLQLTNLHGDVVATASISATATSLASTSDTTEFGVPRTASPSKYSWLGGAQRETTLASGVVSMGARSYIPQVGRFLQTDPVSGGSANAYAYSSGDPVNNSDPSGEYTVGLSAWLNAQNNQIGQEVVAREAAREAAARAEAEAAAAAAAQAAEAAPGEFEGPGWSDPDHDTYLTAAKTMGLATALRAGGKAAEELIGHYFKALAGIITTLANSILEDVAAELEGCYYAIEGANSRARCKFTLHTMAFVGVDTFIPRPKYPITIAACYYFKKAGPHNKRGFQCG